MSPSTARARLHLWLLIAIASLGLLQGCSGHDGDGVNDPPTNGSIIMPLAIGNSWAYERTHVGVDEYDMPDTLCLSACSVGGSWYRSGVTWEVIATNESVSDTQTDVLISKSID